MRAREGRAAMIPSRLAMLALAVPAAALAVPAAALAGAPRAAAASTQYAEVTTNRPDLCAPGRGTAVELRITGLRSARGNLFVRAYHARGEDWLRAKRYLIRVDAVPRAGSVTVCVPLPGPGRYAIAAHHDADGDREMDVSSDGAAMSNNPEVRTFLGIPRPPAVEKAAFTAAAGVNRLTIAMRYRD